MNKIKILRTKITMQVLNVDVPAGVGKWVVTYEYYNWTGSVKSRKNYYNIDYALESYMRGIKYIGSSEDYEKVGIYYVFIGDDKLNIIQSYDTLWGCIDGGEMV